MASQIVKIAACAASLLLNVTQPVLAQFGNRPTMAQQMTVSPDGVDQQTGRFTNTDADAGSLTSQN